MFLFIFKKFTVSLLMLFVTVSFVLVSYAEVVKLGSLNEATIGQIIASAQQINSPGDVIVALSGHFKGSPYAENTLLGGPNDPEEFVLNLSEFDCFTFLDVVESLRRSSSYGDFAGNLKAVRYFDDTVSYQKRRHFFSDWVVEDELIEDVTAIVAKGTTVSVNKNLNQKDDGSLWLAGVDVVSRQIDYIPTLSIDEEILSVLRPGDYIGIYSPLGGLDVSHTGIIFKDKGRTLIRHASSRSETGKVIDEDLLQYLQGKPGLIVYRVKA
jgi:hypothetical protein